MAHPMINIVAATCPCVQYKLCRNQLERVVSLMSLICEFSFPANDPEAGSCFGTSSGLSVGEDRIDHYSKMFKRYINCTRVKGNLEITGIESPMMDVSFLKVNKKCFLRLRVLYDIECYGILLDIFVFTSLTCYNLCTSHLL